MIYSGPFSVAKISAHGPGLSRIIPTPGKCSFSYSQGCVQCDGSTWGFPLLLLLLFPERFIPHTHGNVTGTWEDQDRSLWQAKGLSDGSSWAPERPNGAQTISGPWFKSAQSTFWCRLSLPAEVTTLEWEIMEFTPCTELSPHPDRLPHHSCQPWVTAVGSSGWSQRKFF